MARPIKKRATKASYLGSGAGSLKSGTGATAKKPRKTGGYIKTKFPKPNIRIIERPKAIFVPLRPKKAMVPLTPALRKQPKSPATGVDKVFDRSFIGAKKRRKTTRTMRRRAKR